MKVIIVDNVKYQVHPVYENYAGSKAGKVINVNRRNPMDGHNPSSKTQYHLNVTQKINMGVSRFIWECFNGLIDDKKAAIFHVNRNMKDNRLKNLKLTTISEITKSVHNKHCSYKAQPLKAINCETKKVSYYERKQIECE